MTEIMWKSKSGRTIIITPDEDEKDESVKGYILNFRYGTNIETLEKEGNWVVKGLIREEPVQAGHIFGSFSGTSYPYEDNAGLPLPKKAIEFADKLQKEEDEIRAEIKARR